MAKKKELDKETEKIESVGQAVKDLVGSAGWAEARRRLFRKVAELNMITSIDLQQATPEIITQLIAAKTTAGKILLEWLRDIEGTAEQHSSNAEQITAEIEQIVMEVQ